MASQNSSRLSVSCPTYTSVVARSVIRQMCMHCGSLWRDMYVHQITCISLQCVSIECDCAALESVNHIKSILATIVQFHPCLTTTVHPERGAFPQTLPCQWTECWALLCSGSRGVSAICGLLVQSTCRRRTTSSRGCPLLPGLSVLHPPSSSYQLSPTLVTTWLYYRFVYTLTHWMPWWLKGKTRGAPLLPPRTGRNVFQVHSSSYSLYQATDTAWSTGSFVKSETRGKDLPASPACG